MVTQCAPRARQRGVTYFWTLFVVFLTTLALGRLVEDIRMAGQRARERDLLYTGNLYRNAIRQYVLGTPIGAKPYPEHLEDLLRDPRYPVIRRYMRRLYPDPITGHAFALIPAPEGGVMGIRSTSHKKPIKTAGFPVDETSFAVSKTYEEWEFVYLAAGANVSVTGFAPDSNVPPGGTDLPGSTGCPSCPRETGCSPIVPC